MKKTKFTEAQITFALRQAETGTAVKDVCRKMGISEATFYIWKKKFGGLGVTELKRLRQLEEENNQLKQIIADLSLDKQMLQDVLKKALKITQLRSLAEDLMHHYRVSKRRACRVVQLNRSGLYYVRHRRDDKAVRERMKEIAQTRVRYGCARIQVLLRREGWKENHNRVHRIYKEEGLTCAPKDPGGINRLQTGWNALIWTDCINAAQWISCPISCSTARKYGY